MSAAINLSDTKLTQCRMFSGVIYSPSNICPRCPSLDFSDLDILVRIVFGFFAPSPSCWRGTFCVGDFDQHDQDYCYDGQKRQSLRRRWGLRVARQDNESRANYYADCPRNTKPALPSYWSVAIAIATTLEPKFILCLFNTLIIILVLRMK